MKILAIETSGTCFSVALAQTGSVIAETFWHGGLAHSEKLITHIEWLLAQAQWQPGDIEKIAVSTGPGSFTGIRVGMVCARTMSHALGLPLVGITTLEILAAGAACACAQVYPAIDALRNEAFVLSKSGQANIVSIEQLCARLKKSARPVMVAGTAAIAYHDLLKRELSGKLVAAAPLAHLPRAGVLALVAGSRAGAHYSSVTPVYIRKSWAEEKRKK